MAFGKFLPKRGNSPGGKRVLREVGITVAVVSGDFGTKPVRKSNGFVGGTEFDLAYYEAFVGSMELIDFQCMNAVGVMDEMPGFLYYCRLGKSKQLACIFDRYFHFPFKTTESPIERCTFDGDKSRIVSYTYADCAFR